MWKYILSLLVIAIPPSVAAGGTVSGWVDDAENGNPLPFVSISVVGQGATLVTGQDGRFTMQLAPGTYTIQATKPGYRTLSQEAIKVKDESVTEVRWALIREVIPLDEIEVVADPIGASDFHLRPAFVTILERETFEGRSTSVTELLAKSTGVQIQQLGGLGTFSTISVRGSSAEQVTIFLDGIPLNSSLGGGVNLSSLPLSQIDRIEVYRGAQAEGVGMGGTVHLRTRSGGKGLRQSSSLSIGSFGTQELNAMVSRRKGKQSWMLLADYSTSDNDFLFPDDNGTEYNSNDDEVTPRKNNDFRSWNLLSKLSSSFGKWDAYVQANLYGKHLGIPGISNNQSLRARLNTFRILSEVGAMNQSWLNRFLFHQRLVFTLKVESFIDRNGEVGVGNQDNRYETQSLAWDNRVETVFGNGHTATWGSSIRRETYLPESRLSNQAQLFKSNRWAIENRLGFDWHLPGKRGVVSTAAQVSFQRNRMFDENPYFLSPAAPDTLTNRALWSFRSGIRFDLTASLVLKLNVGRSQRSPSFFELFGDRGGVVGNTDLSPESGLTWDAGFRLSGKGDRTLESVYFDHRYKELIQLIQTSQGIARAQNVGSARVRGVELTASERLFQRLSIAANYTYQEAVDQSSLQYRRGQRLPNRPAHEVSGRAGLDLWKTSLSYEYTYEDGNYQDHANLRPISARHIHNIGMKYLMGEWFKVSVEAKNIRRAQVADLWGYPLPGRAYFVTLQESF